MLDNLYVTVVFVVLFAGIIGLIAGFFLGFIPVISRYKLPIQVVSMVLFSAGLWLGGRIAKDREWKAKVAELEVALAEAKVKSAEVNTETVIQVVTKKQIIKEKGDTVYKFIRDSGEIGGAGCVVAGDALKAHNAAATGDLSVLGLPAGSAVPVDAVNAAASSPSKGIKLAPKK